MDDEVVKGNPAESANAAESGATTDENQGTQAEQPADEFERALGGESNSSEDTSSIDRGDEPAQPENSDESSKKDDSESNVEQNSDDGQNAKGAKQRKEQLSNEIRELVARRNAIREETSRLIKDRYGVAPDGQAKTEDELINTINPETGDYYTRAEAQAEIVKNRLDQIERERQQDAFANQIAESRLAMSQEVDKVIREFPMFDPNSEQYSSEIADSAFEIISGAIETDPQTGMQIGCKIPIYKFYSVLANAVESAKKQGEISGREAAQKMMEAVDTIGSDSTQKASEGELDDFERSLLED